MAVPARSTTTATAGFTLLEALVAMMIVSLIVISFIGIRTSALMDATQARNWRLAREIAEEKLSELQAGARETPADNGATVPIEKYEGFAYKIVIGEAAVADVESEIATNAAGENAEARDRVEWQRDRENYRRASSRGLSASEYDEKRNEDVNLRLAEKAPSETEFEEVAVVVYFPKMDPSYPDEKDALLIKARLSTLAIRGVTPQEAANEATSRGQSPVLNPAGSAAPGGGTSAPPLGGATR